MTEHPVASGINTEETPITNYTRMDGAGGVAGSFGTCGP